MDAKDYTQIIITVLGFLLADKGLILYHTRRKDNLEDLKRAEREREERENNELIKITKKLEAANNKHAEELIQLGDSISACYNMFDLFIYAFEKKDILNGNATEIKACINKARTSMEQYTKSKKDKELFV